MCSSHLRLSIKNWRLCGVVPNVIDSDFLGSEFGLQLRYYIHFRTNTLGKGIHISQTPPLWQDMTQGQFLSGV